MRRSCLAAAWILALVAAGCAMEPVAPSGPAPRAGFVQKTLDNGLVVLCQEKHAAPVAVVQVYVRAGSLFEEEYSGSGISHLCEHLVAGGSTTTRPEAETRKILDSLGGETNAATGADSTTYYIETAASEFDTALQLVSDWMQNATIPQEEFDREKQVIQREIEMGLAEPGHVLWQLAARTTFQFHPARFPVIGYKDLFVKLTRDDVIKYYQRVYAPDNMFVVAAGDFDAAKTADRVAELFRNAKRGGRVNVIPAEDPPQMGMRTATAEMEVSAAYALLRFRTVPLSHPDLYALDVMSYVLSSGDTSRLVHRLRKGEQLVDSVSTASYTPWTGAGRFDIQMVLKPENVEKVKMIVLQELERLKEEPVSAKELARVKKQFVADYIFGRQTVDNQAGELGENYLASGNPFLTEFYLRGIELVRASEIQRVARKYLTTGNLTISVVRPTQQGLQETAAVKAAVSPVEQIVLPNGLRVLVRRNTGVPVVSIQAYFLGGLMSEDEKTAGLSNLFGQMLTAGTKTRSAFEISSAFDDMAGGIEGGAGNNTCFLRAHVLAKDFPRAFGILADCLVNPVFPEDELGKAKTRTLDGIGHQNDDWYTEAHNLLMKTLYKVSPYRLDPLGTPDSVKAITRDTLIGYHRRTCAGSNGVVAVFGDVDPEQVKKLAGSLLGSLPPGKDVPPLTIPKEPPLKTDVSVEKVNEKKSDTAAVQMAYLGCQLADVKDRDALMVLDAVMSGMNLPSGWLHEELRGKGLVYLVHARSAPGLRTPGYFEICALTRPDQVDEVVEVINKSIVRAKSGLVAEGEFEDAKRMALTAELLSRQTNESLGQDAALNELYGFGYGFSDGFADRIRAVTREDVLRVARKYLTRRALVIVRPGGGNGKEESQKDGS